MILVDAGPLVALVNRRDQHHRVCTAASRRLPPEPLLTTWPCFTEAMYFLGDAGGYAFQSALWHFLRIGQLAIHDLSAEEMGRTERLMQKYRDTPMDLADASLVAIAESLGVRQVFTLDHHFRIYRLANGSMLEPIPD